MSAVFKTIQYNESVQMVLIDFFPFLSSKRDSFREKCR